MADQPDDELPPPADEAVASERQKEFTRRALLRAGWTVPLVTTVNVRAAAAQSPAPHNDAHGDHVDTPPHVDVPHTDHADVPHTDHVDVPHTDHADVPHTDHVDVPHTDHVDVPHTDHVDVPHTDHADLPHQDHQDHADSHVGAGLVEVNPSNRAATTAHLDAHGDSHGSA